MTLYVVSSQRQLESRSMSLIKSLQDNNIDFTQLFSSHSSVFYRVFKVLFLFICSALFVFISTFKIHKFKVIVLYNSHPLIPFFLFLHQLGFIRLAIDLGYPFSDNTSYSKGAIFSLNNCIELLLTFSAVTIYLETDQQCSRLLSKFPKATLLPHFCYQSNGLIPKSSIIPNSSDFSICSRFGNYVLFRGKLNPESGILSLISDFISYKKSNPDSLLNLVVCGSGLYSHDVSICASQKTYIYFQDQYLDSAQITNLVKSSLAMFGQYEKSFARLQYTLPHKFFEALVYQKLYISPCYDPLFDYYSRIFGLKCFVSLKNREFNLSDWLLCVENNMTRYDLQSYQPSLSKLQFNASLHSLAFSLLNSYILKSHKAILIFANA